MKKVKYTGKAPVVLPTLNLTANTGDVLNVPADFEAEGFEVVFVKTKEETK